MQEVAQHLDVVLEGHVKCLRHGCTLKRCILVDFIFLHDKMVEILFDNDTVDRNVVAEFVIVLHHLITIVLLFLTFLCLDHLDVCLCLNGW